MRILFVQHKDFINGSGGTEKICTFLANHFASLNYQVEIATNDNVTGDAVFPLDINIKVTNIFDSAVVQESLKTWQNYNGYNPFKWIINKIKKKKTKFKNRLLNKKMGGSDGFYEFNLEKRSEAWKKYIDSLAPKVIITMSIGSLLEITYKNEYNIPIINSVNGRPDYDYSSLLWYRSEIEMSLLKESYKKLSAVQILFDSYKNYLPETFHNFSVTIPNPVPQIDEKQTVNHLQKKGKYKIINIASLASDCKQQNVAIAIFAKIALKYPNWDLEFWGTGVDYEVLDHQIRTLNLQDRIYLKGFTDHPLEELKKADIFVFPSKYEGFPLALTEAMSVGLPSIGFKTCSGVNELIKDHENGFLSADENEMTINLESLIKDAALRQAFGTNAHFSMKKYDKIKIFQQWETLVNSVL